LHGSLFRLLLILVLSIPMLLPSSVRWVSTDAGLRFLVGLLDPAVLKTQALTLIRTSALWRRFLKCRRPLLAEAV
jgi:hypothetical protein